MHVHTHTHTCKEQEKYRSTPGHRHGGTVHCLKPNTLLKANPGTLKHMDRYRDTEDIYLDTGTRWTQAQAYQDTHGCRHWDPGMQMLGHTLMQKQIYRHTGTETQTLWPTYIQTLVKTHDRHRYIYAHRHSSADIVSHGCAHTNTGTHGHRHTDINTQNHKYRHKWT